MSRWKCLSGLPLCVSDFLSSRAAMPDLWDLEVLFSVFGFLQHGRLDSFSDSYAAVYLPKMYLFFKN